jgi:hypothetical protein
LQGAQLAEYEKKRAVREALQEGKPLPTELRTEAADLKRQVELEDDNTAVQRTNVDDEYGDLGISDPQVLCNAPQCYSACLCELCFLSLATVCCCKTAGARTCNWPVPSCNMCKHLLLLVLKANIASCACHYHRQCQASNLKARQTASILSTVYVCVYRYW